MEQALPLTWHHLQQSRDSFDCGSYFYGTRSLNVISKHGNTQNKLQIFRSKNFWNGVFIICLCKFLAAFRISCNGCSFSLFTLNCHILEAVYEVNVWRVCLPKSTSIKGVLGMLTLQIFYHFHIDRLQTHK